MRPRACWCRPVGTVSRVADRVRITGLTRFNVDALRELLTDEEQQLAQIGATYAEFAMTAAEAYELVREARHRAEDRYSHPYKSLAAVLRKLMRLAEGGEPRG